MKLSEMRNTCAVPAGSVDIHDGVAPAPPWERCAVVYRAWCVIPFWKSPLISYSGSSGLEGLEASLRH
jgi:hypothetical protein